MKTRRRLVRQIATSLLAGLFLAACASGTEEAAVTLTVEVIQTEAVATFSAGLTATAEAMPTKTPTQTETPTPNATSTIAPTNTAAPTAVATLPEASCYGLSFVSDVTIPDDTTMTPSQTFTKTWRVRNSGSCDWQTGFDLNFTGGEAMGGSSISLASAVQPGAEIDLSVPLQAPTTAGTYRGNWRVTDAGGTFFGDEVDVQIVVAGSAATATSAPATATPTATPTETPTETATP